MRILQVARVFGSTGGIQTYVARLSDSLIKAGHQTAIAAGDLASAAPSTYEVVHIPELAPQPSWDTATGRRRIRDLARSFRADCVLLHHVGDGQLLKILHEACPTVEFVHSFICAGSKLFRRNDAVCNHAVGMRCLVDWYVGPCGPNRSPREAIRSLRQARNYLEALATVDLVVVGSQFMKRYLAGDGLDDNRIKVVDMSIGLSAPAPARPRPGLTHVVFVGRAVYGKGIQYLIRAMGLLGTDCRLTVVGDGWYLETLKRLTSEHGLVHRVSFAGALAGEALRSVLETATVGVVPSIFPEPSGLVVPEMRACGLPVVVTDVGGLPEWASQYSGIYVADAANAASMAAAIRTAAEMGAERVRPAAVAEPMQLADLLQTLCDWDITDRVLASAGGDAAYS